MQIYKTFCINAIVTALFYRILSAIAAQASASAKAWWWFSIKNPQRAAAASSVFDMPRQRRREAMQVQWNS